jgi:hypothetical protein
MLQSAKGTIVLRPEATFCLIADVTSTMNNMLYTDVAECCYDGITQHGRFILHGPPLW